MFPVMSQGVRTSLYLFERCRSILCTVVKGFPRYAKSTVVPGCIYMCVEPFGMA